MSCRAPTALVGLASPMLSKQVTTTNHFELVKILFQDVLCVNCCCCNRVTMCHVETWRTAAWCQFLWCFYARCEFCDVFMLTMYECWRFMSWWFQLYVGEEWWWEYTHTVKFFDLGDESTLTPRDFPIYHDTETRQGWWEYTHTKKVFDLLWNWSTTRVDWGGWHKRWYLFYKMMSKVHR